MSQNVSGVSKPLGDEWPPQKKKEYSMINVVYNREHTSRWSVEIKYPIRKSRSEEMEKECE